MHIFEGTDACVSPVLSFDEAPEYPHNVARQGILGGQFQASPAPRFDKTPAATPSHPLAAGESTDDVLTSLGLSGDDIAELRAKNAVG